MEIINLDSDFDKLINSVDDDTTAKTFWTIKLLQELGYRLRMPYCKKILGEVFELRICGKIEIRLFYLFRRQNIIIFHSLIKKLKESPNMS